MNLIDSFFFFNFISFETTLTSHAFTHAMHSTCHLCMKLQYFNDDTYFDQLKLRLSKVKGCWKSIVNQNFWQLTTILRTWIYDNNVTHQVFNLKCLPKACLHTSGIECQRVYNLTSHIKQTKKELSKKITPKCNKMSSLLILLAWAGILVFLLFFACTQTNE